MRKLIVLYIFRWGLGVIYNSDFLKIGVSIIPKLRLGFLNIFFWGGATLEGAQYA